jgi:predicted DNA repair protein MutK
MAAGGLLALLDDLTVLMDDIAAMSKVAAQKTAGITGDDLAVNAQALHGIDPKRELPIIWSVAKGSLKNKCFLIPGALFLNFAAPWAIMPLLMAGGVFLCFEGVEKILHAFEKDSPEKHALTIAAIQSPDDLIAIEKQKIRQAINTDLILSAEIVAISLGTVLDKPFITQAAVLIAIGLGITVVVYGLVGGLIKLDDIGLYLTQKKQRIVQLFGRLLVVGTPKMMKVISVLGTAAIFMVGGGILTHGIPPLHHILPENIWLKIMADIVVGLIAGGLAVVGWKYLESPCLAAYKSLKSLKK